MNSSASKGISNLLELYPAKSQLSINFIISFEMSLNVGSFFTYFHLEIF